MLSHSVVAQPKLPANNWRKPVLRHVQGLQGLEANVGRASIGWLLTVDWSYYLSRDWQIKLGIGGEVDSLSANSYRNIFAQPVVAYTLLTNNKNIFVNVTGGGSFNLESHQKKKSKKWDNKFNMALVLGGELELFLVKRFELLLAAGPRMFLLKSPYGRLDYYLSLGLRITF